MCVRRMKRLPGRELESVAIKRVWYAKYKRVKYSLGIVLDVFVHVGVFRVV